MAQPSDPEASGFAYASVGGGVFLLRGERYDAANFRAAWGKSLASNAGKPTSGVEFGLMLSEGDRPAHGAEAFLADLSIYGVSGRLRYGLGVVLGASSRWVRGSESKEGALVFGPRAFASVDLFRIWLLQYVLGVEAMGGAPGYASATATLGVRLARVPFTLLWMY